MINRPNDPFTGVLNALYVALIVTAVCGAMLLLAGAV